MDTVFVGLGRMGLEMARRVTQADRKLVAYDTSPAARDRARAAGVEVRDSLEEAVRATASPRVLWLMLPAGDATREGVVAALRHLRSGDILVDGGNSDFREAKGHHRQAGALGIEFLDIGTSGGVKGAREGAGFLVGGEPSALERCQPLLDAMAAPHGWRHVGGTGAGHFSKAVHNGIEYAIMHAFAEGYELMVRSDLHVRVLDVLEAYQAACSVRGLVLEKILDALRPDPLLRGVKGSVADSGMGRWTVEEAVRLRVPVPLISGALFARFHSQSDESPAMKMIAALRGTIGGHKVEKS